MARRLVPGLGFVTDVTPDASDSELTPLLAFGLRYVEQLIIRPGQRARHRAQLKAPAVLEFGEALASDEAGAGDGLSASLRDLARKDFQIKIRGFRVELGEIEEVLRAPAGSQVPGWRRRRVSAMRTTGADEWAGPFRRSGLIQ